MDNGNDCEPPVKRLCKHSIEIGELCSVNRNQIHEEIIQTAKDIENATPNIVSVEPQNESPEKAEQQMNVESIEHVEATGNDDDQLTQNLEKSKKVCSFTFLRKNLNIILVFFSNFSVFGK